MKSAPRARIKVINLNRSYTVNERIVKRIAVYVLKYCRKPGPGELEIIFLTNNDIKPLNKRYKGEDRPTDVLSFDLGGIAEIFISIDKASENSKIFNTTLGKESTLYVIHAILHLIGYDDETGKERARMEKTQKEILQILCKKENLSKVLTPR